MTMYDVFVAIRQIRDRRGAAGASPREVAADATVGWAGGPRLQLIEETSAPHRHSLAWGSHPL